MISKMISKEGRVRDAVSKLSLCMSALFFGSVALAEQPTLELGGQYRINAYSGDAELDPSADRQTASRARIRQNINLVFDERFRSYLQLELGHTTGNLGTTGRGTFGADNPGTGEVRVRHAVMEYAPADGTVLQAGIVPLSDRFDDVLFSSDWDYNPVALAAEWPVAQGTLRAAAASISEGDETIKDDDVNHFQLDYASGLGGARVNFGASFVQAPDDVGNPAGSYQHVNYGVAFELPGERVSLNGFVLGSRTDAELIGSSGNGSGVAAKLELNGAVGPGEFGVMATYAGGESDGSGFIPVMSLVGTNGYWGYTGLLTVQGPTDTGIDGDAVNISNNGYGLTTVQARYAFPITSRLSGYIGAGWFGGNEAAGRESELGTDLIVMGTYRLHPVVNLDFGAAAADLKDGVSPYYNGVAGGFRGDAGGSRQPNAVFARLQAEF